MRVIILFLVLTLPLNVHSFAVRKARQKKRQLHELIELENDLHARGFLYVIGADDSGGAGCIAGDVICASCCVLKPFSAFLPIESKDIEQQPVVSPTEMDALGRVNDCKQLTKTQREEIYDIIREHSDIFAISVSRRSPKQIDESNINKATQDAFAESIEALSDQYKFPFEQTYAVVDGKSSPKLYASQRSQSNSSKAESFKSFPVRPYVNGDANVFSVALASIIARIERDKNVKDLNDEYPLYGFAKHAGFGHKDHVNAIHKHGAIDGVHRMTFKQVKGR